VERFLKKVEFVREQIPNPIKVLFFGFRVNLEARDLIRDSKSYMLFSNGRFLKVYP
jgi:hypothetical protein